MRNSFFLLLFLLGCSSSHQNPAFQTRPDDTAGRGVVADHAMVVTANAEATKAGLAILQKGGNAIDAAIAVQFALAVAYPDAGNIGGGGFMVLRMHDGETNALDFREKAPSAATQDMFIDPKTNEVDHELSESSLLSAGVPGSVDGMWQAFQKYGTLKWNDLVQPAIDLATNGFPLTQGEADDFNEDQNDFQKYNPHTHYFEKDSAWKKGDTLIQSDLAKTLTYIRDKGRDGFYEGPVAAMLCDEMKSGGIMNADDLKNYHAIWRTPVSGHYKNYTVISMPPPSSGGVALIQLLEISQNYPLNQWGFQTPPTMHLMAEAEKRVYADRSTWLGDPDFFNVPARELIDSAYLRSRMLQFDPDHTTPSSKISGGEVKGFENDQTTHFSIVDAQGNAVSITTTLNNSYGSKIFVAGAGFLLNDEMDDFSSKPGVPNMYGLIGGKANAIEPDKRMLSSMTPTILLKNDSLFMVIGSPGGATIITAVFQCILNVIEFNLTMQQSVNAPRFHHQWMPDELYVEENKFPPSTLDSLKQMGYTITPRRPMGRVDAILVFGHRLEGGADPRGDDIAMGF